MKHAPIKLHHSLFSRLRELDRAAKRAFHRDFLPGLGTLGLILQAPERLNYWCTPENVITFASTGGDGVHFSFLLQDKEVTEASPVVMTVPMAFGHPNWIVGLDLRDFLCLGAFRGYFALEQVAYNLELTLRVFTDPDWHPTENWHYSVGYALDDEKAEILELLVRELRLEPWRDPNRLKELQDRFIPFLRLPSTGSHGG